MSDPERIIRTSSGLLGTAEVDEIEEGKYLTFEYIGDRDYFNESKLGKRARGSQCTSVDASFLHRTSQGVRELVLIDRSVAVCEDRNRPGVILVMAQFDSYEYAQKNDRLDITQRFGKVLAERVGETKFVDLNIAKRFTN